MKKKVKKTFAYNPAVPKSEPMLLMDSQTLTISPQGQITIPKAWRDMLDIKPGAKIFAMMEKTQLGKTLKIWVEPDNWIDKMAGISKGKWGNTKNIDDYVNKTRDEWEEE